MPKRLDLTGRKFGNWSVLNEWKIILDKSGKPRTHWLCKCICKKEKWVYQYSLTSNKSIGCGAHPRTIFGESAKYEIFINYQSKAKRRKISFELSELDFYKITQKNCFYCKKLPSNINKGYKNNGDYIYNGIDRVDSNLGYSIDNCVPCCINCNKAKMDLTQMEFFNMIKRIYEEHKLNERK